MIRVDLRSSRGEVLESVPADPKFDPVLLGVDRVAYPILGHLDPYGDTVLNRMQVRTLLGELKSLEGDDMVVPAQFRAIITELCEKCLARPHQFLWFIGE
jgi:hypothetical protein